MENQQPSPKAKKPFYKKWWFIAIVALIIIGAITGTTSDKPLSDTSPTSSKTGGSSKPAQTEASKPPVSEPDPEPEAIEISAVDLIKAYDDNGVKADQLYKGNLVLVTGIVKSIDTDIMNEVYVTIGSGEQYEFTSVQCYFKDKDEIAKVADLTSGEEITILGTCNGSVMNVSVKNCIIKQ